MGADTFKILLVEDSPADAGLVRTRLAETDKARFEIRHVERLSAALECLGEERFDGVLLDLSLPDSQGMDTFVRLRAASPDLPIVVLTGHADEEFAFKTLQQGGQDFLFKTRIDGYALMRALRYAIERQRVETRLKAALQEKEILLKEIHHRVKNNLQVVSSLLSLQARHLQDPQMLEILQENQRRVQTMALVHEKLYQSEGLERIDFAEYIHTLVADLVDSHQGHHNVVVHFQLDPVALDIHTAIPCGLILNELVTNALKHAFPKDRKGTLRIALSQRGDQLNLSVGDDGVGLPPDLDFHRVTSLGLKMVQSLTQQLRGELQVRGEEGTRIEIAFPRD